MGRKAEFMVVRQYVIDALATSGGRPIRFPPTRKLGEMLGVSQPTALRAIKDLITDGYLISCNGGGTMSCPKDCGGDTKVFGLLTHLGKLSFDNYYFCSLSSAVALELTRRSESYCIQNLYLESPSLLDKTVQGSNISGLILLDSRAQIAENAGNLNRRGLPVVSFFHFFPGLSSFYTPLALLFAQVIKKLFAEQRTHLLIIGWADEDIMAGIHAGVTAACGECGVPEGQVLVQGVKVNENPVRVEEILNFGMKFDGVIFYPFLRSLYDLIRERMDTREECRLVCDELSVFDDINYTGYVIKYDLRDGARKLVDNLLRQIQVPDTPTADEAIGFTIKTYQEGKEI